MPTPFRIMMPGAKAQHLAQDKDEEHKAIATYGQRQAQHPEAAPMYQEMQQDEMDHASKLAGAEGGEENGEESTIDADDVGLPKIDPTVAGYFPPDKGPFRCGSCVYFEAEGACALVGGPIEADGCCNLFTPGTNPNQGEAAEGNDQEPVGQAQAPDDTMATRGPQGI